MCFLVNLSNSLKRWRKRRKSFYFITKSRFQINGIYTKHNLRFLSKYWQCQCNLLIFIWDNKRRYHVLEMIKTIVFIKFSRIKSILIWKCGLVLKSNSKCYEEWLNSHYLNKDIFPFLTYYLIKLQFWKFEKISKIWIQRGVLLFGTAGKSVDYK